MPQILCIFLCLFSLSQLSSIDANNENDYKLTILHTNDLFSAFAGIKSDNSLCDLNDDLKQCIGGAPKIVAQIRNLRKKEFLFFLNAGNNLGGYWYNQFGPNVVTDFFQELEFSAIALGLSDYEFKNWRNFEGNGINNLTEFLTGATHHTRIVSCNIDANTRVVHNFYSTVRKSVPLQQFGVFKIAIIGFAKPPNFQSNDISDYNYLNISEPIKCLQEETEKYRKQKYEIIIAIGSGDQQFFKEIVDTVPNIDLVIGSYGFSRNLSLLSQRTADKYPDLIVRGNGGERIVVTADVLGQSVGKLSLTFDDKGNIKKSEGTLIKLDQQIEEMDLNAYNLVRRYHQKLYIGTAKVYLNGSDCSTQECNLGNLISDSVIFYHNNIINDSYIKSLIARKGNDVLKERIDENRDVIALIDSKIITNSIGNVNTSEYFITKISLDKVFNRGSPKINLFILSGETIRQLLKNNIKSSNIYQVSGLRISYDLSNPINPTIMEISVKCKKCLNETYTLLDDTKLYEVLLTQTIEINDEKKMSLRLIEDLDAFDILTDFIRINSPINTTVENRIAFIGVNKGKNLAFGAKTDILMTLFSTLIAVCHLRVYN